MRKIKYLSLLVPLLIVLILFGIRWCINKKQNESLKNIVKLTKKLDRQNLNNQYGLSYNRSNEAWDKISGEKEIESKSIGNIWNNYNKDPLIIPNPSLKSSKFDNKQNKRWQVYEIKDVGLIKIPTSMEIRDDNALISLADSYKENMEKTYNVEISKSKIIFQPKGMNDRDNNSFENYSRIILDIQRGKKGEFLTNSEISLLSKSDLDALNNFFKDAIDKQLNKINGNLIEWVSPNVKYGNSNYYIQFSFIRDGEKDSNVRVESNIFYNKSEIISLTISYRISEKEMWKNDLGKVADTFRLDEIKK